MKTQPTNWVLAIAVGLTCTPAAAAGVEIGNTVKLTIRGVPNDEQPKINGDYRVGDEGGLRLPMLDGRLPVVGLSGDQIASAAEAAYRKAGIYQNPAIEVEILNGTEAVPVVSQVSVGGQVNKSGPVPFRKGLTLLQALQAAGDRNAFGGRKIKIFRGKKVIELDFRKPEHKNFPLFPEDSIVVEPRGAVELDRG